MPERGYIPLLARVVLAWMPFLILADRCIPHLTNEQFLFKFATQLPQYFEHNRCQSRSLNSRETNQTRLEYLPNSLLPSNHIPHSPPATPQRFGAVALNS